MLVTEKHEGDVIEMDANSMNTLLQNLLNSDSNRTAFDETWTQGRSAFGGLSAAFAVTSMRKTLGSPLPLRSLMVSFIAPLPSGEIEAQATIQRQGKNVTQMSSSVYSSGNLCLQAMAAFGHSRDELVVPAARAETVPRGNGIQIADHARRLPAFLGYFEGEWVSQGLPFSGQKSTELQMWVRHRSEMKDFAAEKLVAIADIPPPVVLSFFDTPPVPASSLTWSLEFVISPEKVESDWFYLDFTAEAAAEGYTQQSGRIYTEDGQLCALTRQCMVYFGNRG